MASWKNGGDINEFMFANIALVTSWSMNCRETLSRRGSPGATSAAPTRTRRGSPGIPSLVRPPHPDWCDCLLEYRVTVYAHGVFYTKTRL